MKLTPTTAMIIQVFIEAAIMRVLRDMEGMTEEELEKMGIKQPSSPGKLKKMAPMKPYRKKKK